MFSRAESETDVKLPEASEPEPCSMIFICPDLSLIAYIRYAACSFRPLYIWDWGNYNITVIKSKYNHRRIRLLLRCPKPEKFQFINLSCINSKSLAIAIKINISKHM